MNVQIQRYIQSRCRYIEEAYLLLRDVHPESKPEEFSVLLTDGVVHAMPKTQLLESFKDTLKPKELEKLKTTPKPTPPRTVAIWVLCIRGPVMGAAVLEFTPRPEGEDHEQRRVHRSRAQADLPAQVPERGRQNPG